MSGLEVVGIAASIVQIAEIGTQLAVKLCAFYHKIKTADQRIQNLSNNVALTSSVLKLLGDNLQQDEQAKLYSKQAFGTTQGVLDECKGVFEQIRDALDQSPSKGLFQRAAKKLSFVAMEGELELLGRNLERLKSTLHLMLNVIMYAGQLRSRTEPTALKDQRDLIQSLLDHKRMSERRFEEMTKALEGAKLDNGQPKGLQPEHLMCAATLPTPTNNPLADLGKYYLLVKKLLADVDSYRAGLEQTQHSRVRSGVLRIHNDEIQRMEVSHGPQMAQMFRNRIYELSDRPADIEQHIFGPPPKTDAEPPRPVEVSLPTQPNIAQPQMPSQEAQYRHFRGRTIEVLTESNERVTQNRPSSTKPPYQPAPAPQSPAPVQNPSPPFLDTIRALDRLSPAQLSKLDRLADSIRGQMEKSALERIEAQLHVVNAGRYDGDIVQLFFRRKALEQLQRRRSQMQMGSNGSPAIDPRNLTNGASPDIYGLPAQQQQQQQQQRQQRTQPFTNPVSIHPAQGNVDLDGSYTQADAPVRRRAARRSVALQPSPYDSLYADPLGFSQTSSPVPNQQLPERSEYLPTPRFILDSPKQSSSELIHHRSRSDTSASFTSSGDHRTTNLYSQEDRQQSTSPPFYESSPREQGHDFFRFIRKKRHACLDDGYDSPQSPVSPSFETAVGTPPQGVDGPITKAAPNEVDDLVLQWTTVGGDEIATALRVD